MVQETLFPTIAVVDRSYVNSTTHPLSGRLVQCFVLDPKRLCTGWIKLFPSVTRRLSSSILGSRAHWTLSAVTDGRAGQAVVPLRSTATNIGTRSSDKPRLLTLPPLRRTFRSRLRSPLRLSRTLVTSASTMPLSLGGLLLRAQEPMQPIKRCGNH